MKFLSFSVKSNTSRQIVHTKYTPLITRIHIFELYNSSVSQAHTASPDQRCVTLSRGTSESHRSVTSGIEFQC
nr:hypothetical protein BgiMline_025470 [Biomphalaria glabrata]